MIDLTKPLGKKSNRKRKVDKLFGVSGYPITKDVVRNGVKQALYLVPGFGTGLAANDMYHEPNILNGVGLALSLLGDAGVAAKGASVTGKDISKAVDKVRRSLANSIGFGNVNDAAISTLFPVDKIPFVNSNVKYPKWYTGRSNLRTRVGDVEIDNPNMFYRQGSTGMGEDFLRSGVVSSDGVQFPNPMYSEGMLWYGIPNKRMLSKSEGITAQTKSSGKITLVKRNEISPKTDLLTSYGLDMVPATQRANRIPYYPITTRPLSLIGRQERAALGPSYKELIDEINDAFYKNQSYSGIKIGMPTYERVRRVPKLEGGANKTNTVLYRYTPGYGYREVKTPVPTTTLYPQLVDTNGNILPLPFNELVSMYPYLNYIKGFKNGGSIHINPANRGKFTATMKRTGKTAEELSHSSNPLTRKRAIFALNARKWNK